MLFHPLHPLVATIPSSRLKLQPHTGLRTHYHVTSLTSVQMVIITKVVMLQPHTVLRTHSPPWSLVKDSKDITLISLNTPAHSCTPRFAYLSISLDTGWFRTITFSSTGMVTTLSAPGRPRLRASCSVQLVGPPVGHRGQRR